MNPIKKIFHQSWNRAKYKQIASFELKKLDLLSHRLNHDISLPVDNKFWIECLDSLEVCSEHYPKCKNQYKHYKEEYCKFEKRFLNKKET